MNAIAGLDTSLLLIAISAASFLLLLAAGVTTWYGDAQPDPQELRTPAPLWWRVAEPWLRPLARRPGVFIARADRARMLAALQLAGIDDALRPEQIAAARLALAIALAFTLCAAYVSAIGWQALPLLATSSIAVVLGFLLPRLRLIHLGEARRRSILKELPFHLDLLTLCIEAGMGWTSAIAHLCDKGPPGALAAEWRRVLHDIKSGRVRADALRAMALRLACPEISSLVAALVSAERSGASVGEVLRNQAVQRRSERFHRAEALALQAPTRMLLPLIVCIFPCTFLLLMFPIAFQIVEQGLLR